MDTRTKQTAREILAVKLRQLMSAHARLRDRDSLETATGVSARTIGYMLEGNGNPTINNVEKVAGAYGLEAWEMLFDPDKSRGKLVERLFGPPKK